MNSIVTTRKGEMVQDPPLVQKLLSHPLAGLLWLPLRIWLGYQWFVAGSHKISNFEAQSHGLHARCLRFAATVARVLPTAAQDSLPAGGPPWPGRT